MERIDASVGGHLSDYYIVTYIEVHKYCINVYSYKLFEIITLVESSDNKLYRLTYFTLTQSRENSFTRDAPTPRRDRCRPSV